MSKRTRKRNKKPFYIACGAIAVVIIISITLTLILKSSPKLDDSFFVTDSTKYVLTFNASEIALDLNLDEYNPEKAYQIYFHSKDKITELNVYYKYEDEEIAKKAANYFNTEKGQIIESIKANGKYVVIKMAKSFYQDMTADYAKQQYEFYQYSTE